MARFIVLLLLIMTAPVGSYANQKLYSYILSIDIPTEIKKVSGIKCLYHGSILPCSAGQYIMQDKEFRPFFSLIITPQVTMEGDTNTLCVTRVSEAPCKWYNIALNTEVDKSKTYYSWTIEELKKEDMPLRLPEHTAIILELPPEYIEVIESKPYTGCCVHHLPTIHLKKSLRQKDIDTSTAESALGTIDLRSHHSYQRRKVIASPTGFISTYETLCP